MDDSNCCIQKQAKKFCQTEINIHKLYVKFNFDNIRVYKIQYTCVKVCRAGMVLCFLCHLILPIQYTENSLLAKSYRLKKAI